MPYWSLEQEQALKKMFEEGKPIEEIAEIFHRSVEAVVLKAKRLGVEIPEKCRAISESKKEVESQATTTTLPAD